MLQAQREGRTDTGEEKARGLGPPFVAPGPGELPHPTQVLIPPRALATLCPGPDGMLSGKAMAPAFPSHVASRSCSARVSPLEYVTRS